MSEVNSVSESVVSLEAAEAVVGKKSDGVVRVVVSIAVDSDTPLLKVCRRDTHIVSCGGAAAAAAVCGGSVCGWCGGCIAKASTSGRSGRFILIIAIHSIIVIIVIIVPLNGILIPAETPRIVMVSRWMGDTCCMPCVSAGGCLEVGVSVWMASRIPIRQLESFPSSANDSFP